MILVDTSIWVDHLRSTDQELQGLLERSEVLGHAFVLGELALGRLARRESLLRHLRALPQAVVADHEEVLLLIEQADLAGTGLGYVDAHLLAASRLTPHCRLWTRDKRLDAAAEQLRVSARMLH